MIGRITGTVVEKQAPDLLVDVRGVGYELQVSLTTFFDLPAVAETVTLYTHFVVREDAQQLYGFADKKERELFRTLVKVSGVGPKMALAILSGMAAEEFVACVQADNTAALVRLPGVGKKTAERLIVEMRDRLDDWQGGEEGSAVADEKSGIPQAKQEAESALVSLGYKPQEAARMVNAIAGRASDSESLIRLALQATVK